MYSARHGTDSFEITFLTFFPICTFLLFSSAFPRQLSADHKSNIGEFKHNTIVEIAPVCKDDLVILPKELAKNISDFSPLALVKAVNAEIHVTDPLTGEVDAGLLVVLCCKTFAHSMTHDFLLLLFRFDFLMLTFHLFTASPRHLTAESGNKHCEVLAP